MITALSTLIQAQPAPNGDRGGPAALLDRIMHWALNSVPQVVQMAGGPVILVVLGILVALLVWKRNAILSWWRGASPQVKAGIYAIVGLVFTIALLMGGWVWNYVQHDNEFCNSCHVMQEPFERFTQSEHAELGCHDCHQASLMASANQLHMWVLDRPDEVGPHAPVPREICVECHVTEDPQDTWERISATAGHRVHLEADTSALADVTCVTCHGEEVHRFLPADETCGQSGCHASDKTQVVLGNMAGQTGFHCITCHEFTAPVAETSPLDTVRQALVPGLEDCASCHEMENILVGFQPDVDPHDAVCGTCHNPHTQELPEEAREKCAQCHATAELSGFHRGIRPTIVEDCSGCHEAHTFRVDGEDCLACHADILGGTPTAGPRRQASVSPPPVRPSSVSWGGLRARSAHISLAGLDGGLSGRAHPAAGLDRSLIEGYVAQRSSWMVSRSIAPGSVSGSGRMQQQPFDHRSHRDVACTQCHSMEPTHGEITLASRESCFECHHTRPVVARGCASCHEGGTGAPGVRQVSVSMSLKVWQGSRSRELPFDHAEHAALDCASCHTGGIRLTPQRACADCHDAHHAADRDCMACHRKPPPDAHTIAVHTQGCAECHGPESYGRLGVGRSTCLACHQDLRDHRPGRACADCHQVAQLSQAAFGAPP